jgi:prepilin-type N-terminal cleavage/methylation domain-containing protein
MVNEKGFSFLEIIVALALLGLVAVAFLSGLGTSTKATTITRDHAIAESLVRSELEYIRDCVYQYDTDEYEVNPMLDMPKGWSMAPPVIEPVHETDDGIQKVTVSVEHNGDTVLSLFTYKADR